MESLAEELEKKVSLKDHQFRLEASIRFVKDAAAAIEIPDFSGHGLKTVPIKGLSSKQVLGSLYHTVNSNKYIKDQNFEFIGNNYKATLIAMPTDNQPGNGLITTATTYKEALKMLQRSEIDEKTFVKFFRSLSNPSAGDSIPSFVCQIYFLLLFEVTRRMRKIKKNLQAEQFDSLPIAVMVARLILLMEAGYLTREQVFDEESNCHIFKGLPEIRQQNINNVNNLYRQHFQEDNIMDELDFCFNGEEAKRPKAKQKPGEPAQAQARQSNKRL